MKLPLIDDIASAFFDEIALEDYYILGVQHILYSTHRMCNALFKKGLPRENLSLIGKCYSTEHDVYEQMLRENIDVCSSSISFDSHQPFDISFKENLLNFLEKRKDRLKNNAYKKIIILDDGGALLELAEQFLDRYDNIVGMEQTSSGYNILKHRSHKFPIINLARAEAKLAFEPATVVDSTLDKIFSYLDQQRIEPKKILILGRGFIGSRLQDHLKSRYETVLSYDKDHCKSDLSDLELHQRLKEFDLIFGCTGQCSLPARHHQSLKKGAILVSMSSSDREFDAIALRQKTKKVTNCWEHLTTDGIRLLNCGFPMTFHGHKIDDPQFFQLIRALIMASIYQGIQNQHAPGFVDLCSHLQKQIVSAFQK